MRVLQVCADRGIPPGGTKGASAHLAHVAGALSSRGHEVRTLARALPEPVNTHPVSTDVLEGPLSIKRSIGRLGGADLIYERYSLGHLDAMLTAEAAGIRFALEVNAPLTLEARAHRHRDISPAQLHAERRLFTEAPLVFPVSHVLADHVVSIRGTTEGVTVIANGAHPNDFPIPAHHETAPTLVFLGHPKPWHGGKGLPVLAASLAARFPDLRVIVVGGGAGAREIVECAHAMGVSGRFEITGPVDRSRVAALLCDSSVGVAPYPHSDFFYFSPLKIVEYMMAGLPVVATDVGDVRATLGPGGFVVPPGNPDMFAEACASLLADREERLRVGTAGRDRASLLYTWDAVAAQIETAAGMVTAG
ncbi:MAG: glycosyltransferase family 4 protein [Acidimicrobiia bacterium]|nr:glycosyltransferase family 4 protein [Acidimicrobiia bacterium]